MSSNTKIVVLRSKELIYTIVLLIVGIFIIAVLLSLFLPTGGNTTTTDTNQETTYVPGVYSTTLSLGNTDLQLQVTVDSNHINDISFVNLSETVATMYPLVEPTLSELSAKIIDAQSIELVSYSTENKYTSLLLLHAVSQVLEKAEKADN